ncbi:hypothetical protein [Streptomyces incanus]
MEWGALDAKGSNPWAILEAKKTGKKVVASDGTAATSVTVAHPDGALTTDMTSGPERVRRKGMWREVDVTVTTSADGSIEAKKQPSHLRPAGQGGARPRSPAAAQTAAARDLVIIGSGDQASTLQWTGGLPTPEPDGSTARYREAVPGAVVIVEATRTGFEQFVQIHDRPSGSSSYTLPVKSKGLKAKENKDGSATFTGAKAGQRKAKMPGPVMWDAAVDKPSGHYTDRVGVVADWGKSSNSQPPKHTGTASFLVREGLRLGDKGEGLQRNFIAPRDIQSSLGTVSLGYWDVPGGGDTICDKEFVGPDFTGPASWTSTSSMTEQTVQTRNFTWNTAAVGDPQELGIVGCGRNEGGETA